MAEYSDTSTLADEFDVDSLRDSLARDAEFIVCAPESEFDVDSLRDSLARDAAADALLRS
jgi:hypothetical protein